MMKHRHLLPVALVVALTVLLATVSGWASGGAGTEDNPYKISETSVNGDNFYQQSENKYYFQTGNAHSSSYVTVDGSSNITGVHVAGGEYVTVSNGKPVTLYAGGHLTLTNASAVTGSSGGYLTANVTGVTVSGTITQLAGSSPVAMKDNLTITSGGGTISNSTASNSYTLTVNSETVKISGYFGTVDLGDTATVEVIGNTYIGTLTGSTGKITITGGRTLTLGGNSTRSVTMAAGSTMTANVTELTGTSPTLKQGTYDAVAGGWTVDGNVTINGTKELVSDNSALTLTNTADENKTILNVNEDASLTFNGGKAKVCNTSEKKAFALTQTAGALTVYAKSDSISLDAVTLNGGTLTIGSAADTITAASLTQTSGTLTVNCPLNITGDLKALQNSSLATGTLTLNGDATVTGTATIDGVNVKLASEKTLKDNARSIKNDAAGELTLTTWNSTQALLNAQDSYTVTLGGNWTLPTGKTATVKHEGAYAAAVIGTGGTLTLANDAGNVYAEGYFAAITVPEADTATLKIKAGKRLCDAYRAVTLNSAPSGHAEEASISAWTDASATLEATDNNAAYDACMEYGNLTGVWAINGNIYVNGTDGSVYGSHGHAHTSSATISGSGTVYTAGGATVAAATGAEKIHVVAVGATYNVGSGGNFDAGTSGAPVYVKGTYATLKGNVILNGDTTVTVSAAEATVTGGGYTLTVTGNSNVFVKGEFAALNTAITSGDTYHAIMVGDTTVNDGTFGIRNFLDTDTPGENDADTDLTNLTLTVNGGAAHVQGAFKQVNVRGGEVTDCGKVTISNVDAPALSVSGGSVTLDNYCELKSTSSQSMVRTVVVSGGSLQMINGTASVNGNASTAVSVTGGSFFLGKKDNTYAYNETVEGKKQTPVILANGSGSEGIAATESGKAWLFDGEISFDGEKSIGISALGGGWVHVHPNDIYASGAKLLPQLYVHGTQDTRAAMNIGKGGKFEIDGQGAFFQEPRNNTNDQYALYIHDEADISGSYPLAGGTFFGKVYYDLHEVSTLIAPNHYVRYDGRHDFSGTSVSAVEGFFSTTQSNEKFFAPSDGTYGVVLSAQTDDAKNYGSYLKMHPGTEPNKFGYYTLRNSNVNTFGYAGSDADGAGYVYTVADAEWELRSQMANGNGSYQIPAGIIVDNKITLDGYVKVNSSGMDCEHCSVSAQGDLNVSGASSSHTLYLAGRTLDFAGTRSWNRGTETGSTLPAADNTRRTVCVGSGATLNLRDGVMKENSGVSLTGDKHSGAYIGTGEITYSVADDANSTAAVRNDGTLNVYSAKITAAKGGKASGIYAYGGNAIIGMTGNEDTDNQLITVTGKQQAINIINGSVTLNGGVVGDTNNENGTVGIVNQTGVLTLNGGIVTGTEAGVNTTGSGYTYVYGGHLFGGYAPDAATGNSLLMEGGTVYLNINDAHKAYSASTVNAYQTGTSHHINNVTIDNGTLWIGKTYNDPVLANTRINGALSVNGGETVIYDGVVYGGTTVVGAKDTAAFGTKFFVYDGDFGALTVKNYANKAGGYTTDGGEDCFESVVQLHGGKFLSMDTSGLKLGSATATVDHLLGGWSKDYDVTNDNNKDWASYRHYVTVDTQTRDARGNYAGAALKQGDAARSKGNSSIVGGEGGVVTVRDAYEEFQAWLASGSGAYALPTNILLSGTSCSNTDYCKSLSALPLEAGSGTRELNMNGYTVLGRNDSGALITLGAGTMKIRTGASGNNLFENLSDTGGSDILVSGGSLTIGDTTDENAVTFEAKSDAISVSSGSLTLNKGTVTGGVNGVSVTTGTVTVKEGTIAGTTASFATSGTAAANISGGAFSNPVTLGGTGADQLTGGTFNALVTENKGSGSVTVKCEVASGFTLTNGTLTVQDGANIKTSLSIAGGTANVTGGTVSGTVTQTDGTANVTGGTISGAYTQSGGTLTADKTPRFAAFTTSGGTTALKGGTYDSITISDSGSIRVIRNTGDETNSIAKADVSKTESGTTTKLTNAETNVKTLAVSGTTYTIRYVAPAPVSTGGGAAAPATTVSVSGDENSVSISATVSGNTATMSKPSEKELEKVIGVSVETGEVTIDMSRLSSTVTTAAVPAATIKAISAAVSSTANDADELTIKLPNATATFDAAAVAAVTEQMKGTALNLTIAKTAESKLTAAQRSALKTVEAQEIYSVTLVSGNATISDFKGGSATVTVPYTLKSDQDSRGIVVWHIADDGAMTEIPASYITGHVSFTVPHFSDYVIAYDAERAKACLKDETCPMAAFSDLDLSKWYHDGIHWSLENGVMKGVGDGLFRPMDTTTRAMVATMLWRMEGSPVANYAMDYTDVEPEAWYTEAIRWASAEGIVTGYGDGIFGVNDSVTREQLATMLYRYAQYKKLDVSVGEDTNILSYGDVFSVSEYAIPAMQWAVGSGIVTGYKQDGTMILAPTDGASRAVVATMVWRLCK